jgi:hypothetical protein
VVAIIGLAALISIRASRASASEYGVSTYRPGIMDMFAGYLAPPGATILNNYVNRSTGSELWLTATVPL